MKELKFIWHNPSETPRNYSDIIEHHKANNYDNHTLIEQYDIWATGGSPVNPFDEYTIRWAYVEDFLALEQELERTRKALEIIKKEMSKETMPDFAVIHNALKIAEQKEYFADTSKKIEQKDVK